jgi:rhodanese-related sulfurtransferase
MKDHEYPDGGRSKALAAAPLLILALAAAAVLAYLDPFSPSVPEGSPGQKLRVVTPNEAAGIIDSTPSIAILDLRTPAEYGRGHIPDAILFDYHGDDFRQQLAALDRDTPYLLYCATQGRSGQTLERMAELGFSRVWLLQGGFYAWRNAGLPVTR